MHCAHNVPTTCLEGGILEAARTTILRHIVRRASEITWRDLNLHVYSGGLGNGLLLLRHSDLNSHPRPMPQSSFLFFCFVQGHGRVQTATWRVQTTTWICCWVGSTQHQHPTQSNPNLSQSKPARPSPIQANPTQSNPVQTSSIQSSATQPHPIQAHPAQSNPIQPIST